METVRHEYLTGAAVAIIVVLLILLVGPGWATASARMLGPRVGCSDEIGIRSSQTACNSRSGRAWRTRATAITRTLNEQLD